MVKYYDDSLSFCTSCISSQFEGKENINKNKQRRTKTQTKLVFIFLLKLHTSGVGGLNLGNAPVLWDGSGDMLPGGKMFKGCLDKNNYRLNILNFVKFKRTPAQFWCIFFQHFHIFVFPTVYICMCMWISHSNKRFIIKN